MTRVLIAVTLFFAMTAVRAESPVKPESSGDGIHFVKGLSWNQILAKAKSERKFIFVDCYTTWCAPCKRMEKEVYSRQDIGERFNHQFICVKAQLDSSKSDDETTRAFYPDAHYIETRYEIRMYPTLLFFNPDGNILNSVSGAMQANDLVKLANDVQNPKKDYYALLERYKKGERDLVAMGYLARTARNLLHDSAQAAAIARDYLTAVQKKDLFSKGNIEFTREFTRNGQDPGFSFFFKNADSIDKVMKSEDYSEGIIQHVLYEEIVRPEIKKSNELKTVPDWDSIAFMIVSKYNQYFSDRVIMGAKLDWSGTHKEWSEHTKDLILYVEKFTPKSDSGGTWQAFYLNNCAWDVFEHSKNTTELEIALHWSSRAVMMDPAAGWMDTYANLLYKLGRRQDALKWEAVSMALNHGEKAIDANYEAMKAGKPTWPLE